MNHLLLFEAFGSESLYPSEWSEDKYKKIIESEFALIINLSELKKGLKDLVVKRKEARKGATALYFTTKKRCI